jgi:hypothetical protein
VGGGNSKRKEIAEKVKKEKGLKKLKIINFVAVRDYVVTELNIIKLNI